MFTALRQMTGPPCKVKLTIAPDKDLFPDLREPHGKLLGELEPGGKDLELYAEGIKLDPSASGEDGLFHLTIDGLELALSGTRRSSSPTERPAWRRDTTGRGSVLRPCASSTTTSPPSSPSGSRSTTLHPMPGWTFTWVSTREGS